MIHTSFLTPEIVLLTLQDTSQHDVKTNFPLPVRYSNTVQYLEVIELKSFLTNSDLVFVLKVSLIQQPIFASTLFP